MCTIFISLVFVLNISSDFPVVLKTTQIIVNMTSDKNLSRKNSLTLLHLAAGKGHFQVCTFVMENLENNNPGSSGPISRSKVLTIIFPVTSMG